MPSNKKSTDIVLRLLEGTSEERELVLDGGTPQPPFTVGIGGAWRITAGRVAKLHVMLAFNGKALYVCAVGRERAHLDGVGLDSRWVEAATPSELRFGGARVSIGRKASPEEETQYPSFHPAQDEATRVSDVRVPPAAQSGRSSVNDAVTCFDADRLLEALAKSTRHEEVTCLADVQVPAEARRPPVVTPAQPQFRRPTVVRAVEAPALRPAPLPSPTALQTLHSRARTMAAPEVRSLGVASVESAGVPSEAPVSDMPLTEPSEGLMPAAFPSFQVPFKAAQGRPSSPTMAIPQPAGATLKPPPETSRPPAVDSVDGIEKGALASTGERPTGASSSEANASAAPASPPPNALRRFGQGWKEASLPKRAIALLMLPALAGSLFIMRPSSPALADVMPPRAATAVTSAPAPIPPAAPTSAPKAAATIAVPTSNEAPKFGAAGLRETRTPERRALDTAASGDDRSAADQYELLATAHPENIAFREAVRLLRARSAAHAE